MARIVDRLSGKLSRPRFVIAVSILAGSLGIVVIPHLSNPFTLVYPPALVAGGLVTLFIRQKAAKDGLEIRPLNIEFKHLISIHLFVTSALVLEFAKSGTRGLTVYFFTFCLYLLSLLAIFSQPQRYALAILLSTALIHRATMSFAGPTVFGNDTLFHLRMAESIAKEGSREPLFRAGSHYFSLPNFHILLAVLKQLGIDIRVAGFVGLTIPYTILPVGIIYGITNRIKSGTTALVAAFLFVTSDYALGWSVMPTTTGFGLIFFSVGLYSFVKILLADNNEYRYKILLIAVSITIAFSHHLSAVLFGFTLLLMWTGTVVQGYGRDPQVKYTIYTVGIIIAAKLLYARLTGINEPDVTFLPMAFATLLLRIASTSIFNRASISLPSEFAVGGADALTWIHTVGGAILVFLGIVGLVWKLQVETDSNKMVVFNIGITVGGLYFLTFVGPLAGIRYLQPMRFFQFIYVPLGILAALGIIFIVNRLSDSEIKQAAILGIFLIFHLSLMGSTFIGSIDDPILDEAPGAERFEMNEYEHAMYQHAAMNFKGSPVVGDRLASVYVNRYYLGDSRIIRLNYSEQRIVGSDSATTAVMVRPEIFTGHTSYKIVYENTTVGVFMPLPREAINCGYREKIYAAGKSRYYIQRLRDSCLASPRISDGVLNS